MNCVQTVSYEILINGVAGKPFYPRAGIRQGDPLSPYLFSLCTKVLSQLLLHAENDKHLTGIKISRSSPPVSHLLFVDDSIFFMTANIQNCLSLEGILILYCQISGQRINESKSAITFSPNCTLRTIRNSLKILKVTRNKNMRLYLGLPTDFGTSKREVFPLISEKVRRRILSWNNVYLSSAGRLTLIRSVLSSLSVYSLSAFKMSGSKELGGIGICNIGCLNQSLLAKADWRIIQQPEGLLSRVLGTKYRISKDTIFDDDLHSKGSLTWGGRGILWGLELLKGNQAWQVGFPSALDVWRDNWIHGSSLAQLLSLPPADLANKPFISVSELQTPNGDWDFNRVQSICGGQFVPLICSIPIPCMDDIDKVYWPLNSNGIYSTKSGYKAAFSLLWTRKVTAMDLSRIESLTIAFCKNELWSLPITGKWKVFLWKILSNSLPTSVEVVRRGLNWNFRCQLCFSENPQVESMSHIFQDCTCASQIWFASSLGIRSNMGNNLSIQNWIINWLSFFKKNKNFIDDVSVFVSTHWRIWCFPNNALFRESPTDFYTLFKQLDVDASNNIWAENQREKSLALFFHGDLSDVDDDFKIRNHFPHVLVGTDLCSDHIRIKYDAFWKTNLKAAGWIFHDKTGIIFHRGQAAFWAKSPYQPEATTLRHAISDAISQGYKHIDTTTDCLNLILQVNGIGDITHDSANIIHSIDL
ncbi:uncharacterized protein LOC141617433 [Silene latifolia]|uniref:uncharacterized protein LOC141617433 n=1 Tax=Silene latifolia TaxID=37657 RepID=UPI003D787F94